MEMRQKDFFWGAAYILFFAAVAALVAKGVFNYCNEAYPYISGFVQFAVFATGGELLSTRILYGKWQFDRCLAFKAAVWGSGGLLVTLMFSVLSQGVAVSMEIGMLPFFGNPYAKAFFTSCLLNLFFAPLHAATMRILANYAEERFLRGHRMQALEAVRSVEWGEFVDFSFFKTIPFFWIPINTVGFLLPISLQVAFAALLSFVFGMLMTLLKLREKKKLEGK